MELTVDTIALSGLLGLLLVTLNLFDYFCFQFTTLKAHQLLKRPNQYVHVLLDSCNEDVWCAIEALSHLTRQMLECSVFWAFSQDDSGASRLVTGEIAPYEAAWSSLQS